MNLIFDIGANRGAFTGQLLSLYPQAAFITVEANPALKELLINRFSNNKNVTVISCALSTKHGEQIPFYICAVDTISTAEIDWISKSRFKGEPYSTTPILVDTTSLDTLISRYGVPDLIKVDVEGYELAVVKGLTKKAKTICFEWAEEQYAKINQTVEHLQSLGYSKFAYTVEDRYTTDLEYTAWENCNIHDDIKVDRKERWGMIWTTD